MKFDDNKKNDEGVNSQLKSDSSPFSRLAMKYYELGYSILPVIPAGKCPGDWNGANWIGLSSWSRYCTERASIDQIESWSDYPNAGISLACGPASHVIAVDYDEIPELQEVIRELLPPASVIKKGARGATAFYKYNGEASRSFKARNRQNGKIETVIEILSAGKHTVLPPSIHPSGVNYEYVTPDTLLDITPDDLPTLPEGFVDLIQTAIDKYQTEKPASADPTFSPCLPRQVEPIVKIEDALQVIPSDEYHSWIDVGRAICAEHPRNEGYLLWDKWSQKSSKYKGISETSQNGKAF